MLYSTAFSAHSCTEYNSVILHYQNTRDRGMYRELLRTSGIMAKVAPQTLAIVGSVLPQLPVYQQYLSRSRNTPEYILSVVRVEVVMV